MTTFVIGLYFAHPVAAIAAAIAFGRRLRTRGALRFTLLTATALMVVMGIILGVLIFVAQNTNLKPLGVAVILAPLPVWALAGCELYALRRSAPIISLPIALPGMLIGGAMFGAAVGSLMLVSHLTGVH